MSAADGRPNQECSSTLGHRARVAKSERAARDRVWIMSRAEPPVVLRRHFLRALSLSHAAAGFHRRRDVAGTRFSLSRRAVCSAAASASSCRCTLASHFNPSSAADSTKSHPAPVAAAQPLCCYLLHGRSCRIGQRTLQPRPPRRAGARSRRTPNWRSTPWHCPVPSMPAGCCGKHRQRSGRRRCRQGR